MKLKMLVLLTDCKYVSELLTLHNTSLKEYIIRLCLYKSICLGIYFNKTIEIYYISLNFLMFIRTE